MADLLENLSRDGATAAVMLYSRCRWTTGASLCSTDDLSDVVTLEMLVVWH